MSAPKKNWRRYLALETLVLAAALVYPMAPALDWIVEAATGAPLRLDRQLVNIYIFAILTWARTYSSVTPACELGIALSRDGAFSTDRRSKYRFRIGFLCAVIPAPSSRIVRPRAGAP